MSNKSNFIFKVSSEDRKEAIDKIINSSSPRQSFFLMVILAAIIATLGLFSNNVAVVIGAMLVSPILSPVLSLSLGIVLADFLLVVRSLFVILKTLLAILAFSFIIAIFIPFGDYSAIFSNNQPSLLHFYIALAAGVAASLAIVKKELSEFLPGTIIAVALLPPLCNISIGLRMWRLPDMINSFELFLINIVGIIFASVLIFSLLGFYSQRREANKAIIEEKKELGK
ncbi:MAG: TIGR00341 family protein [Patescibacteria group bacterium]